MKSADIAGANK